MKDSLKSTSDNGYTAHRKYEFLSFIFTPAPPDFPSTVSIITQFKEAITFYLRVCMSWEWGENMLSNRLKGEKKEVT